MASAMRVFRKFRASDGRIKAVTAFGVLALAAVLATLGILPALAAHVDPDPLDYGGGPGGCTAAGSVATNELHMNNPTSGTFKGPDGTEIKISVNGRYFGFEVLASGMTVYDVTVNGGSKSNLYHYADLVNGTPATEDTGLHAPIAPNGDPYNLSHVNICYDGGTVFQCNVATEPGTVEEGSTTLGTTTIFANSFWGCETKLGAYIVHKNNDVTLNFGNNGGTVAGMATFTKEFGNNPSFTGLTYDRENTGNFREVQWCGVRGDEPGDGAQFDAYLDDSSVYPTLSGVTDKDNKPATACKVYEEEDAGGTQFTVVYFEFEDPQFR